MIDKKKYQTPVSPYLFIYLAIIFVMGGCGHGARVGHKSAPTDQRNNGKLQGAKGGQGKPSPTQNHTNRPTHAFRENIEWREGLVIIMFIFFSLLFKDRGCGQSECFFVNLRLLRSCCGAVIVDLGFLARVLGFKKKRYIYLIEHHLIRKNLLLK